MMKRIVLYHTRRQVTINDEDYEYLNQFRWYLHSKGYAVRTIPNSGSKKVLMHIEIMERMMGRNLEKLELVDHINRVPLCNLRSNLRIVSQAFNRANSGRSEQNKSGYRGVSKHKLSGLWRARLTVKNKEHCSYHKTRSEASKAFKEMLKKYYPAL